MGILKIKAKLGELMPAENGGRGKKTPVPDTGVFSSHTISAYRKLAKHLDRLEDYYESTDDAPSQTRRIDACGWSRAWQEENIPIPGIIYTSGLANAFFASMV
ncbi:MAG: hypothetical protein KDA60_19885 [Planctomycetales bacterium]|nr:hypothetical protein [Planctomycetales bacterium]